jgi:transglutaminase-like putative cysteine protease
VKYKITHSTQYTYSELVPVCHNQVRLTPRDDARQRCESHRLLIAPDPVDLRDYSDYYGNRVSSFSILEAHPGLNVTAVTQVEVTAGEVPDAANSPPWERVRDALRQDVSPAGLDRLQFVFDSPRVRSAALAESYASKSFPPGRPIVEAVLELTCRIHEQFAYDPAATTVSTPVDEVFTARRGVCQDFAHAQLACLRKLGLAARYVSGYIRTLPPPGKPRLVGADASHAWVSVYCGEAGWVDFDPTNNVIAGTDHITLAWGRDYDDVCPIRGVLVGGKHHTMHVSVDVAPLDD